MSALALWLELWRPLAAITVALFGAALGLAQGIALPTRKQQAVTAIINASLGVLGSYVVIQVPGLGWLGKVPVVVVSGLLAYAARWVVPEIPGLIHAAVTKLTGGGKEP